MATYAELRNLLTDSSLTNKVTVAVGVAAETIRTEAAATTNHANRLLWAKRVFEDPVARAKEMLWAVVIANRAATVAQILTATDLVIQANVDAVVDIFATGG